MPGNQSALRPQDLARFRRVMKQLPEKTQKRVVNNAMRAAANVVKDRAIDTAVTRFETHNFTDYITVQRGRGRRGVVKYRVGIEGGSKTPDG